jgi:hypothetical protein
VVGCLVVFFYLYCVDVFLVVGLRLQGCRLQASAHARDQRGLGIMTLKPALSVALKDGRTSQVLRGRFMWVKPVTTMLAACRLYLG